MRLTAGEQRLASEGTRAQRLSMRILMTIGEIYGADRLIPAASAHVSGVSYRTIGDSGVEFLEDFARDGRVAIPTTANPMVTELERARALGIPRSVVEKQSRVARAYARMGVRPSFSCTPYLIGNRPRRGDHVAWAESSAAIFANSVIGARTNREGGPSALAAAVTGRTPNYGLHRVRNRRASVRVDVRAQIRGAAWSLLGLAVGRQAGDGVPYLSHLAGSEDDLKWLGAAMASVSEIAMYHIERTTPEWRRAQAVGTRRIRVSQSDLKDAAREYTTSSWADAIGIGSPQISRGELRGIARLMHRRGPRIPVLVFASRTVRDAEPDAVREIERRGGTVFADTCLEVTMLEHRFRAIATPSGKAAVYLPALCHQRVVLRDLEELLEMFS